MRRMSTRGPLEQDTCRDYVVPRLKEAGWSDDQIVEQHPVTDGRVVTTRGRHGREKPLRADYLLEIASASGPSRASRSRGRSRAGRSAMRVTASRVRRDL